MAYQINILTVKIQAQTEMNNRQKSMNRFRIATTVVDISHKIQIADKPEKAAEAKKRKTVALLNAIAKDVFRKIWCGGG